MKKNYLWIAAALFAGILTLACNKEQDPAEEVNPEQKEVEMVTETISARLGEGDTKVQIAEETPTFTWSTGDRVAVRTNEGWFLSNALTEAGASATFTVTYSGTREAFAIFPSSLVFEDAEHVYSNSDTNNGSGDKALTVNLPSSYALADVSGDKAPCPMIATNTAGEGWEFKHLCGLLRLTINGIPAEADHLTIDFLGRQVNGAFTIANGKLVPGDNTCVIETTSSENDVITISGLSGETSVTVNIPLPTGDYDDVVITPYKGSTQLDVMAIRHIKLSTYTASRAHRRKLTATLVSFTVNGSGKNVVFAPANLVATITGMSGETPTAVSWRFHDHSWSQSYPALNDIPNVYASFSMGQEIDYFGWGTSGWDNTENEPSWVNYQPWNMSTDALAGETYEYNIYGYGPKSNTKKSYSDDGAEAEWAEKAAFQNGLFGENAHGDWGVHNDIGPYPKGTWRTPSSAEWDYLINGRTVENDLSEGARFMSAHVGEGTPGKSGGNWDLCLVIFPDKYSHPADVTIGGTPVYNVHNKTTKWKAKINSFDDCDKLEAAGAVILFGLGMRRGVYAPGKGIGYYWTIDPELTPEISNSDDPKGECNDFRFTNTSNDKCFGVCQAMRYDGKSVRLVRDL